VFSIVLGPCWCHVETVLGLFIEVPKFSTLLSPISPKKLKLTQGTLCHGGQDFFDIGAFLNNTGETKLMTKFERRVEVKARVPAGSVLMFFGTRALLKRAPVPTACRALCVLSTLLSTPKRAQIQKS
jgi:hypothetical protein